MGTGEKLAWHFTPDVVVGFKPKASFIQQHSQEELNAHVKALLAAASYGPMHPLNLTLLYNSSETHQKIAIAVASIRPLKIDLRPRNLRNFLVQGEFRAIISGQSFKLAESIRLQCL
ncbi:periplasmic murein peptide-binding domain protein [Candidatus Erwinia dacicola]|uniref:Periplasmic murein peptide-binding domain protein n=1 Tax=Candidatus Erwinia dacicola TaxID=252393 RepID=A0A328TSN9_9GAMM|nr:periplasmic murein peptide-binding domain protein [Candidatus Erwinia dacicola]